MSLSIELKFGIYSNCISKPIQSEAHDQSRQDRKVIHYFGSRFTYLINLPIGIITRVIDTALAVIYMAASLASLCMEKIAFSIANRYLNSLTWIVPFVFEHVIKIINPNSQIEIEGRSIAITVREKIFEIAGKQRDKKNILLKHVVSRLMYSLTIPISVICRVIDLAIGVIAAVFAIITLGTQRQLNDMGFYFLGITGLVQDIFKGVSFFINPWLA